MMEYLQTGYSLCIPADLLPRVALAFKQYRRNCWGDLSYDDRLVRMETELCEVAECQLIGPVEEWVTVPEAAQMIRCSERYARTLALRLGGIKAGRAWIIPRDNVTRYIHRVPNTSAL